MTGPVSGPESLQEALELPEQVREPLKPPEAPLDPRARHPDPLPSIDSLEVAATQPHAMVNAAGEIFYPDNLRDTARFAEQHGAWFLHGPTP